MEKNYYSRGKLLLTGEYAVLQGATAVAVPTKLGQHLTVKTNNTNNILSWTAKDDKDKTWFYCKLSLDNLSIMETDNEDVANSLLKMLSFCKTKSSFLNNGGYEVNTKTEFPIDYGLGTSSTLINNLSYWANMDPFLILTECFSGSGFDVAVAQCNAAIHYQLKNNYPHWEKKSISFPFEENLFFVHLNKKAISRESIKDKTNFSLSQLNRITDISKSITQVTSLLEFEILLNDHEEIIAQATGKTPIKRDLFPSYNGTIKSLGAWGGDFILVTGESGYIEKFFKSKGYNSIFKYSDLILKH